MAANPQAPSDRDRALALIATLDAPMRPGHSFLGRDVRKDFTDRMRQLRRLHEELLADSTPMARQLLARMKGQLLLLVAMFGNAIAVHDIPTPNAMQVGPVQPPNLPLLNLPSERALLDAMIAVVDAPIGRHNKYINRELRSLYVSFLHDFVSLLDHLNANETDDAVDNVIELRDANTYMENVGAAWLIRNAVAEDDQAAAAVAA